MRLGLPVVSPSWKGCTGAPNECLDMHSCCLHLVGLTCRQLEERCRDLDIIDLKPFFESPAFSEAGFRLAPGGQVVLLARA